MESILNWIYIACVNFMLNAAQMSNLTYRDVNVLILLVIFPIITICCFALCLVPYRK